jgi:filamentous hemagglutinin family protein
MKQPILFLLLIIALPTLAQITTDGTLGPALHLPGPDYQITSDLGQQRGDNLFHSFQDFNLQSGESATFSGPNHIQNVISRVTGGNPSRIDGLFRSTIEGADIYFLNPYGILFGPNARLDVQGSFHASTAHYLRLGDGGRFEARNPNNSILTVAPPISFGFLTNSPAPLSVQGSQLEISEGKTFSLIGGNLSITSAQIKAPAGRINLASVAEIGDVIPKVEDFVVPSLRGDMMISENSLIETSGEDGGSIFIRGGQFVVDNSAIEAKTLGNHDGKVIDIQANTFLLTNGSTINGNTEGRGHGVNIHVRATESITISKENADNSNNIQETVISSRSGIWKILTDDDLGDGGQIYLEAKNISLTEGGAVSASTNGGGDGGNITVTASESVSLDGRGMDGSSYIASATYHDSENSGNAGNILIEAKNISLTNGGYIVSNTEGKGHSGNIMLNASQNVTISGQGTGLPARITAESEYHEKGAGDAGSISIQAKEIRLIDGARISGNTESTGQGAHINIKAIESIILAGENTKNSDNISETLISARSGVWKIITDDDLGNGGHIYLEAKNISFKDGAAISASTNGGGDGGKITVKASESVSLDGSSYFASATYHDSENAGDAGNILVKAQNLFVTNGSSVFLNTEGKGNSGNITLDASKTITISGYSGDSPATINAESRYDDNAGDAGSILIQAEEVKLFDGGIISTLAAQAGGGDVVINSPTLVYLKKGQIITSVKGGIGHGGNIYINHPMFVTLNEGMIKAQADEGHGGDISIIVDHLISSQKSIIDASSRKGVDGKVLISSPSIDISGQLLVLSTNMVNADEQMQPPCSSRIAENLSSFVVAPREGIATSPDDLLPSGPHLSQIKPVAKNAKFIKPRGTTVKSHSQMAYRTGCQPASKENRVMPEQLF